MEKLIKGKVLKSLIGGPKKLSKGAEVELPESLAREYERAGYFQVFENTREDKTANDRTIRAKTKK